MSAVVDNVAAGVPREEILQSYPTLQEADIEAALAGWFAEHPDDPIVEGELSRFERKHEMRVE